MMRFPAWFELRLKAAPKLGAIRRRNRVRLAKAFVRARLLRRQARVK